MNGRPNILYARLGMCLALLLAAAVVSPAHAAAPTGRPLGAEPDAKAESYLGGVQAKLPVKGQPLFVGGDLSKLRLLGQPDKAQYSFVPAEGQPFGQAVRVSIPKRTEHGWDVQVMTPPTTQPLKKGEYVLAVFNARCTRAEGDTAAIGAYIQSAGPTWEGLGGETVIAGTNWKPIFILGQAKRDLPAGNYELTLHLGSQAQTLEIGGILLLSLGMSVDSAKVPATPIIYPGQEDDAPWRKAAAERIERHRKADLTVSVVDKNGKPLPAATVRVEMTRHAYGFGTFLEHGAMFADGPDAQKLRDMTLKLFNRATTPIYWADWGWANPKSREKYLQCAKWAADNSLATRGHCIIYPGWKFMPAAVRALEKDPPALRKRLAAQVVEVVEATKGFGFTEYDVTNELRDLPELHKLLGRDVVAEWFKLAREHAPTGCRMAINENTILTNGGLTAAQQDIYADWIQYLIDHGQGPDVIGMQAHFGQAVTDPGRVVEILDRFAKFGKAIQITEFTINSRDEPGQARYTRDFLTAVFSHPATDAFTMWGFWEGRIWEPQSAMIRKDWTPKPNGQAYMDLVFKQWWTDVTLTVGQEGSCSTRGFLGDYKVGVTADGKEKSTSAKLTKSGLTVAITVD